MALNVLGICGSLRKGSYNKSLLNAVKNAVPAGMKLEIHPIDDLPLLNQDLEANLPEPVKKLKAAVEAADAIVIATPEYNYSIPGVLKNAIDWISRPHGKNSFEDKPLAIVGASPGMFGSGRAQYHLRQSLVSLNVHVLNRPEVMVALAKEKFDAEGNLTDEKTKEKIAEMWIAFLKWTERLKV